MAFAIWNSADKHANLVLSNSDKTVENSANTGAGNSIRANIANASGKYYFEFVVEETGAFSFVAVGIAQSSVSLSDQIGNSSVGYQYTNFSGNKRNNSSSVAYGSTFTDGDVIGVALDLDNNAIWFSKNGTWQNGASQAEIEAGTTTNAAYTGLTGTYYPAASMSGGTGTNKGRVTARFDPADITGTVPAGFTEGWSTPVPGDVAMDMPLELSATGRVLPVHGTTAISMPLAISATGSVQPIHGTIDIALTPAITSVGSLPGKGQISVTMPLTVSASGSVGVMGTFNASFPEGLEAALYGTMAISGTFDADLGGLEAELYGTAGVSGTFDASLGELGAELTGVATVSGTLSGSLGQLGAALSGYMVVTGTFDASLGILGAYLVGTVGASSTWRVIAMNLKTGGVSEYESYAFNSLIEWNGQYYGADDTGIFLLSGDTDAGDDIDGYIRTGITDHGAQVTVRVSDAYVQASSPDKMLFRTRTQDGGTVYTYEVPTNLHEGFDSVKANLGRGMRERYVQYEIANFEGADFETDGVDLVVSPIARMKR